MTRAMFGAPAPTLVAAAAATAHAQTYSQSPRPSTSKPTPSPPVAPQRTAADFERNLDAMVASKGPIAHLAARFYLDIAQACEARRLVTRPTRWQRIRRRCMTMPRPWGLGGHPLKRCFAEGLRCGAEATLRYYDIAPKSVGLPDAGEALAQDPAHTCEQAATALWRARADMMHAEMPHTHGQKPANLPSCTSRAAFDSASDELTVYIAWFDGPDESFGVHHCVPLFVASRDKHRRYTFPENAVNGLPKTCATRGYAPFRYTAEQVLEPFDA